MSSADRQLPLHVPAVIFGDGFLADYVGQIVTDPRVALIELVANSYDAGSTAIQIEWPQNVGGTFTMTDNGTGMTPDQFVRRWKTLSYRRTPEQGPHIEFPEDASVPGGPYRAFGRWGKGRHAAFCFADQYAVETWRDGMMTRALVNITGEPTEPFQFGEPTTETKSGHGTTVTATVERNHIAQQEVVQAIGSKFLVLPWLTIEINEEVLELIDLTDLQAEFLPFDDLGEVTVYTLDAHHRNRTTFLRGISWWVDQRMVGQPSWQSLDDRGAFLDGRTTLARRFSFVVVADVLRDDVNTDWTGFSETENASRVQAGVREYIVSALERTDARRRADRKRAAVALNRPLISSLSRPSRRAVDTFVDEVLGRCPRLTEIELAELVGILASLEQARTGYDLLRQLAACSSDDLDTWNDIMTKWSATEAELVLTELGKRLELIKMLRDRVLDPSVHELHELQPLFARGLWMFGPEFESVEFTSNQTMRTVLQQLFGEEPEDASARRPDFVVLPTATLGVYSADAFDDQGEVIGTDKVLLVELKGGREIVGDEELSQGRKYARELRERLTEQGTEFVVFVLGAQLADGVSEPITQGRTRATAVTYEVLLRRAEARIFNLRQRLEELVPAAGQIDIDAYVTPTLEMQ